MWPPCGLRCGLQLSSSRAISVDMSRVRILVTVGASLLSIISSSFAQGLGWQEKIPDRASLDSFNFNGFIAAHSPQSMYSDSMDEMYQQIRTIFMGRVDHGAAGRISELMTFQSRLSYSTDGEWLLPSKAAFDRMFDKLVTDELERGELSVTDISKVCKDGDFNFYSRIRGFSDFMIHRYLPARLESSSPEQKAQTLMETRKLFFQLYAMNQEHIQELHSQFREEFWEHVYSSGEGRVELQKVLGAGGSVTSFQASYAIAVASLYWFDEPTALYFLKRLSERPKVPVQTLPAAPLEENRGGASGFVGRLILSCVNLVRKFTGPRDSAPL